MVICNFIKKEIEVSYFAAYNIFANLIMQVISLINKFSVGEFCISTYMLCIFLLTELHLNQTGGAELKTLSLCS